MSKVKLNKISVKEQGGQMIPSQPAMSNQQSMVDPMVQQVTEMISSSVNQGKDIVDVVLELSLQQVDQQVIAQALMMGGMQEEDITVLFQQVSVKAQPPGPSSPEEVNSSPQLLARNEELENMAPEQDTMPGFAKSGIEIKPENKGKFTAWAKKRGMSVSAAAKMVMANKDQYPPSVVKMANFAKNAAGWKKIDGGEGVEGMRQREGSYNPPNRKYTLDPRFRDYGGDPRSFMEWYGNKATGDEISEGNISQFIDNPTQFSKPISNTSYNMSDFLQNINPDGNILLEGLKLGTNIKNELFSNEIGENGLKKGAFKGLKEKRAYADAAEPLYYGNKTTYDLSDENLQNINDYKSLKLLDEQTRLQVARENYDNSTADATGIPAELMDEETYFESIGLDPDNKMQGSDFNKRLYDQYLESYNQTYPKAVDGYEMFEEEEEDDIDPFPEGLGAQNVMNKELQEAYNSINIPESERINSLTGTLTEIGDSPLFRGLTSTGKVGYDVANFANNNFYKQINQAKANEDRQELFMADNWASVVTDSPGSKGNYKKNTGQLRSTKDRVVGLDEATFNPFMTTQFGKAGGSTGTDNDGFRNLPIPVQNQILAGMRTGGEAAYLANKDRVIKAAIAEQGQARFGGEGEEAYLANRDRVIKREMAKAKDGNKEYREAFNNAGGNFSKKETKSIIQNLIDNYGFNNETDTIISSGSSKPSSGRIRALNNKMYEAGFDGTVDYNNIFDIIGNDPYNMSGISFMPIPKNKEGGETINLSQDMIAELIAAGADIEIL